MEESPARDQPDSSTASGPFDSAQGRLLEMTSSRAESEERCALAEPSRHSDRSEAKWRNLDLATNEISRLPAVARNDEFTSSKVEESPARDQPDYSTPCGPFDSAQGRSLEMTSS